ncbi:MAG: NYN domain-containing protein [Planctomycetes bacterium]|nr:NYN domain-containing protein [Planctomycetota bacterium]
MRWAIDGYNVMFAGQKDGAEVIAIETRREDLLLRCRKLKDPVVIFFDASKAPPGLTNDAEGRGKMEVVYVRQGSADDAIVEWLKRCGRPNEVRLVTNDRELAARARTLRAKVASVEEFLKDLDPERLDGMEKPKISNEEARRWAKEFGIDPDAKV